MKTIHTFPNAIQELEHVWIPMDDGCRLAARIWMPQSAGQQPVPAILEYIPYRKRDHRVVEDAVNHRYYAGHGYAGVRVDIRGSGESEGVLVDEYHSQELDDGLAILRWIAEQPWCNGRVGMIGISWGGFNGLQIAALRPPQLQAVLTVCSTDDRYADDVHYMGGALLIDNLSWASIMFANNSCPPDPQLVGEQWRDQWFERLKGSGLWIDTWTRNQRRDDYWKHGSVCEDFAAIQCPVYAVSGWCDGYSNAVFRLLTQLNVPRKGLVGPWSHKYPHMGKPGPAIGFLQDSLRWWDHWLKDQDTGIMNEPMVRVWMQDSVAPASYYTYRPGRWVGEPCWPSPHISEQRWILGQTGLSQCSSTCTPQPLTVTSPLRVGLSAGKWCSYASGPDLPGDQQEADALSLTFDSEPLTQALEIFGAPKVRLALACDQPVGQVAVRLCDVAPNGESTRITYGVLNLTHRDSHEHPETLVAGQRYDIVVQLNDIAQHFAPGHRLRLAISPHYWPLIWPAPQPTALTLWTEASELYLPVRSPRDDEPRLPAFAEPEGAASVSKTVIEPARYDWKVVHDLAQNTYALEVDDSNGIYRLDDIDTEIQAQGHETYTMREGDLHSTKGTVRWTMGFYRDDWRIKTETETHMQASATHFHIQARLTAYEGDTLVYEQSWDQSIVRDLL